MFNHLILVSTIMIESESKNGVHHVYHSIGVCCLLETKAYKAYSTKNNLSYYWLLFLVFFVIIKGRSNVNI